jgi:DNA repair ATPase RecN
MAPSELQRQVSQNKNDIESVYNLLTETHKTVGTIEHRLTTIAVIQQRHDHRLGLLDLLQESINRVEAHQYHQDARLDTIDTTLHTHGTRLDAIDATLREHGERFDVIDAKLRNHDERLDTIDATLREHGKRFEAIDAHLREHGKRFDAIDASLQEYGKRFDQLDTKFDAIGVQLAEVLAVVRGGGQRRPAER